MQLVKKMLDRVWKIPHPVLIVSEYAAKISLEDKSGNVMDELVKNLTDLGGWLQGCLWWIIPI